MCPAQCSKCNLAKLQAKLCTSNCRRGLVVLRNSITLQSSDIIVLDTHSRLRGPTRSGYID